MNWEEEDKITDANNNQDDCLDEVVIVTVPYHTQ